MVIDRFISFLKHEKRYSAHTLTAYEHEVTRYLIYLTAHSLTVDGVKHREARTYLAELIESGHRPTSINRSLSALRTYYRFLLREGTVTQNPFVPIKALKTPRKLPIVVDKDRLSALLDSDGIFPDTFEGLRDRVVLEVLFGTGIRLSELLQICEEHI